jgi:hypothetical protein
MLDFMNLQAIVENHQKQMRPKRMTSGERRVLSLQKEDRRLNGQKSKW